MQSKNGLHSLQKKEENEEDEDHQKGKNWRYLAAANVFKHQKVLCSNAHEPSEGGQCECVG